MRAKNYFFIQRYKKAGFYANFENCGKNCENFTQKRHKKILLINSNINGNIQHFLSNLLISLEQLLSTFAMALTSADNSIFFETLIELFKKLGL